MYVQHAVPFTLMQDWHKCFREGRESVNDDTWPGAVHLATTSAHLWCLKRALVKSRHFYSGSKFMDNVQTWFRSQPKDFYDQGIHLLVKHWGKCLCRFGYYFWNKQNHLILYLMFRFHFNHSITKSGLEIQNMSHCARYSFNRYQIEHTQQYLKL